MPIQKKTSYHNVDHSLYHLKSPETYFRNFSHINPCPWLCHSFKAVSNISPINTRIPLGGWISKTKLRGLKFYVVFESEHHRHA